MHFSRDSKMCLDLEKRCVGRMRRNSKIETMTKIISAAATTCLALVASK